MASHAAAVRSDRHVDLCRVVAVAAVVALLATACGGDDPDPGTPTDPANTTTTEEPAKTTETTEQTLEEEAIDRSIYGIDLSGVDLPAADPYEDYETYEDDTGQVEIVAPADWDDVDTSTGERDGIETPGIWASTDLEALSDGYSVPGVQIDLRTGSSVENTLERLAVHNGTSDVCAEAETFDFDDGFHVGGAELWTDCSEDAAALLHVAAVRAGSQYVTLEIQMLTDADIDAAIAALEGFVTVELRMGDDWNKGDGPTTQRVGDRFNIVISHPSAIDEDWLVAPTYDAAVVEFLHEESIPNNPGGNEAGPGLTRFFTFEAVGPGTTTITIQRCEACSSAEPDITDHASAEVTIEP